MSARPRFLTLFATPAIRHSPSSVAGPLGTITRPSSVTLTLKRALDVVASALGLALLSPMFPIVAIAIKRDSPGPIFFRQERVGRNGRVFRIYKFRSMCDGAAGEGAALTVCADRRVTRVGAILRKTKLDELPQLINVLIGDMSLVGPRPQVPELVKFYSSEQRVVMLSLRPGMTDYASILFRNESALLDPDDPVTVYRQEIIPIKFRYYERYSREIGLLNDLRIILATVVLLAGGYVPRCFRIESELKMAPVPSPPTK